MIEGYSDIRNRWRRYDGITTFSKLNSLELSKNYALPFGSILNFGCGDEQIIGYDNYDPDLSVAAEFNSLDQLRDHYDAVIFKHVIEHMDVGEATDCLKWMRKHADNLFIATPNSCCVSFDFWKDIEHVRPYSTPQTLRLLERIGWKPEKVIYSYLGMKRNLPIRALMSMGKDEGMKCLYYEYVVVAK